MSIKNTDCARILLQNLSDIVEQGDLEDIFQRIDSKRAKLPLRDAIEQSIAEAADAAELKAARKQLAALQNTEALTRIVHTVLKAIESRPNANLEDAFKSLVSGTVSAAFGSRDSAAAMKNALAKSALSKVRAQLKERGLDKIAVSGALDDDIAIHIFLKSATPEDAARYNGKKLHPQAIEIAEILYAGKKQLIADMRAIGVQLDERPGHILPQTHSRTRIARAAQGMSLTNGKTAADKARWREDIAELIDYERTLENISLLKDHPDAKGLIPDNFADLTPQKFLDTLYDILTTTRTREGAPRPGDAGADFLNARIIEFKSPEAWLNYNRKYGTQTLMGAYDAFVNQAAHSMATVKFFGPAGRGTLAKAIRAVQDILLDQRAQKTPKTIPATPEQIPVAAQTPPILSPLSDEEIKALPKLITKSNDKANELVADKKAWSEKGFNPQEAEAIVEKYYNPEAFKHIPQNAILVPMPSTSGKNILPSLFAKRISKDTGANVFIERVAASISRKEAKKKTSFWQKLADPVIYQPLEGMDQLKALAAEGRPIYIVEDIHTTGESWLAMHDLLKKEGVQIQGVAILASNDTRITTPADIERIAQKYANVSGSTLDEARNIIQPFVHGKFRKTAEKLEQSLSGKNAREAAQRLAAAARLHARKGAAQRGTHSNATEGIQSSGNLGDLTPPPPTSPQISLTSDQINKQLDSLARVNSGITAIDRLWDDFSGAATHPASFTTESINKALSAWNRMRLLGGSLFANLSDIGLQHPLQLWLQNGLPLWRAFLNPIISAHKLATNKQLNSFLNELGVGIESQFAQLYAQRFTGTITQPGDLISRAEGAFFKSTLLPQFTDLNARAYAATLGNKMANDANLTFDQLSPKARRHLEYYGITAKDWDIIRTHAVGDFNGHAMLIPDKLRNVPDDLIRRTYTDATTPDAIQSKKLDLAHTLHSLYLDATDFASLQQDAYTRALSNPAAFQQGTIARTLWDQFFMFKGFAVAFTTKVLARNIRTSNFAEISLMFGALAIGGTIVHTLNLLRKGRYPDIENMTPADAAAYILQGFLYSGGAGLFGDLLFAEGVKETLSGRNSASISFGPTADYAAQGLSLFSRALQGKDVSAQTLRWLNSAIPYSNHWILKPMLDHSLTFGLQEYLSPGTLRKLEQRAADDKTPFWLPPSNPWN